MIVYKTTFKAPVAGFQQLPCSADYIACACEQSPLRNISNQWLRPGRGLS